VTDGDNSFIDAAGRLLNSTTSWTGGADAIRGYLDSATREGTTEIVMALARPDIPRERGAFTRAAGLRAGP